MAKKGFEASGRMSVEKFEQQFRAEFDVYCDILDEKGKIAKQSASLASLRPKDFKAPGKVDFSLRANMQVANVQKKFKENFGLEIQIYKLSKPDEKDTLASLRKGVLLGDDAIGSDGDGDDVNNTESLAEEHVYNIESISEIPSSIISLGDEQYDTIVIKGNGKKEDDNHSLSFYTSGFEKFIIEWDHNKPITEYIPYLDCLNFFGDDDELMLEIDDNLYLNALEFKLYPAEEENNYCLEIIMASYYFDSDEESLNLINEVDNVDIGLYFLNKNDSDELLENNDGEFSVLEGGTTSFSVDEEDY